MTAKKPFETVAVNKLAIHCDGGAGPLGHPRVYLHIDADTGEVVCPYCSRQFVYAPPQAKVG